MTATRGGTRRRPGPALRSGGPSRRLQAFGVLGGVVLLQAYAGWRRRWMQEDGFINVRIAQQVLAGHGPVFNVGERVEAFTSPLWLGILIGLRILTGGLIPYEWLAVVAGLAFAVAGTVGILVGSVALWTPARVRAERATWLPVGILVPLALPPFWDFATSGLETGLSWAWLGWSFAALATAVRAIGRDRSGVAPPRWLAARYVLVGLGPLVRPELTLYAVAIGAGLLVLVDRPLARRRDRPLRWWRPLTAWAALPLAYQVLRMGYYSSLLPNTALAKGAGDSVWGRGVDYLDNFAGTYRLLVPIVVLAAVVALRSRPPQGQAWVAACVVGPGLVHGLYVVWIGGDYMHGRFWLVPLLAIIAPVAALPASFARMRVDRRQLLAPAATALVAVWALVAATSWRPPPVEGVAIDDQRALVVTFTGHRNPVRLGDQPAPLLAAGAFLADADGADTFVALPSLFDLAASPLPRPGGAGTATDYGAIGVAGVRAGIDVRFVDPFGLADAIAARQPPGTQVRAGHTRSLPTPWRIAEVGATPPAPDPAVEAARRALACGGLRRLLDAIHEPMTPSRFVANIWAAPANTTLTVPLDPVDAERQFCD